MKEIRIARDVFGRNQEEAASLRGRFEASGTLVVNLIGSPGSGKTSLIEATGRHLGEAGRLVVIEGDVETQRDAERLEALGIRALQIETHGACHLDVEMIEEQLAGVALDEVDLLIIENIGNLICPTAFDLGEAVRVVVASTAEGVDKPLKYPEAYHGADACVLNKIDLLGHIDFDVAAFESYARRANEALRIFRLSCTSGEGIGAYQQWLAGQMSGK